MFVRPKTAILCTSLLCAASAGAQTYNPESGRSPLVLLEVPKDAVGYFEAKERLRELFRSKADPDKAREAERLAERLVRDYPRDPENWMMLQQVKSVLNKPLEAAQAARRAGLLIGWGVEYRNGYLLAAHLAKTGNKQAALDALRTVIFEHHGIYRDAEGLIDRFPSLAVLKDDPEFKKITGQVDISGWTREQGWLHDIDFLFEELKRTNPDYRDAPFPAEFTRRYEELRRNVSKLSDEELFIGMQRMLAVLRQGHLALWADETARTKNRFLPLRFYVFPEGIYIIDADKEHEGLIGSRVVAIGNAPAEEALRRVNTAMSVDGEMQYVWSTPRLAESYYLKGTGTIPSSDAAILTLQSPRGRTLKVSVKTLAKEREGRQDKLLPPRGVATPLFLSDLDQVHWDQPIPDHNSHYIQVNNIKDDKDETIDAFALRLRRVLDKSKPKNLVLDLRHNNGGTTQTYPELLRTLIAYSSVPGNQVYVLIGRRSYSAAGNFVTDLERLTDPIFVGEATSECCNLYGDPAYVVLPYSRVQGELTNVKWQLSTPGDRRREMSPEVPVQLTAKAYFAGQDPALDAIFQIIRGRQASVGQPAVQGVAKGAVESAT